MKSPILMVMAGPNGSGKSTITAKMAVVGDYINAMCMIIPKNAIRESRK